MYLCGAIVQSRSPTMLSWWSLHTGFWRAFIFSCPQAVRPRLGGKQVIDEVSSSSHSGIIAGVTVFAAVLLLLVAVLFIYRRRRSRYPFDKKLFKLSITSTTIFKHINLFVFVARQFIYFVYQEENFLSLRITKKVNLTLLWPVPSGSTEYTI